jgi:hypothetical protein
VRQVQARPVRVYLVSRSERYRGPRKSTGAGAAVFFRLPRHQRLHEEKKSNVSIGVHTIRHQTQTEKGKNKAAEKPRRHLGHRGCEGAEKAVAARRDLPGVPEVPPGVARVRRVSQSKRRVDRAGAILGHEGFVLAPRRGADAPGAVRRVAARVRVLWTDFVNERTRGIARRTLLHPSFTGSSCRARRSSLRSSRRRAPASISTCPTANQGLRTNQGLASPPRFVRATSAPAAATNPSAPRSPPRRDIPFCEGKYLVGVSRHVWVSRLGKQCTCDVFVRSQTVDKTFPHDSETGGKRGVGFGKGPIGIAAIQRAISHSTPRRPYLHVLFIRENKNRGIPHKRVVYDAPELLLRSVDSVPIQTVNHENQPVRVVEVVPPQRPVEFCQKSVSIVWSNSRRDLGNAIRTSTSPAHPRPKL